MSAGFGRTLEREDVPRSTRSEPQKGSGLSKALFGVIEQSILLEHTALSYAKPRPLEEAAALGGVFEAKFDFHFAVGAGLHRVHPTNIAGSVTLSRRLTTAKPCAILT